MAVHKPGKVLLTRIPLKFVQKKVTGGGKKSVDHEIPLVPFIDFLVTLVVFLISTFNASGQLLAQQPNLKMPDAKNAVDLEIQPVIAINPDVITLDGRRIADTRTLAADARVERMEQMIQELETLKHNWTILHPSEPFPATVILQADQSIDFRVIKKVMFSSAQAGYANVSFAVNRVGDGKK
jgi:biopolymer transport protein ExbD